MPSIEEFDSEHQKMRGSPGPLARLCHGARNLAGRAQTVWLTVPPSYYRAYGQNTLLPIGSITTSVQNAESVEIIAEKLKRWRDRKLHEFQFVQVAATLLAAAVIGCFSWSSQAEQEEHWLGPAAWYSSLVLSITAVLLSSAEAFIFSAIKNAPPNGVSHPSPRPGNSVSIPLERLSQELSMIMKVEHDDLRALYKPRAVPIPDAGARSSSTLSTTDPEESPDSPEEPIIADNGTRDHHEWTGIHHHGTTENPSDTHTRIDVSIRWNMVFTWQAPTMMMGYSVVAFYVGLAIYVCAPLYDGHEGEYLNAPAKAAIFFLISSVLSGCIFLWCSFWAYRFIDWSWAV